MHIVKMLDNETSYTYFGARYYDADLSSWLSVDPLSDKYPSTSAYMYCSGNPVILIDPNGEKDRPFNKKKDKPINIKPGTETPIYIYNKNGQPIGLAPNYTEAYNCHSYSWHESKGDPTPADGDIPILPNGVSLTKWDNNPADDIIESGARQMGSDENNLPGDIVIYYTDKNKNNKYDEGESIWHSAIVKEVDEEGYTKTVISKMGQNGISENHPDAPNYYDKDPDGNKTKRAYFRIENKKETDL